MPPPIRGEVRDGEGHVLVGHADDDEVVRVVCDRRGERAAPEARAGDEAEADPARREVPLDDGDLGEARLGVCDRLAVHDDRLALERLRHDLILDQPDRADRGAVRRNREIGCGDGLHPHRLAYPLGHCHRGHVLDRQAALEHDVGREADEVGQQEEIRLVAGGNRAEVVEPVPLGGVERGQQKGVLGRDAGGNRLAHHPVDVTVLGDVLGVAVVGAERHPAGPVLEHERKQRLKVARHRRLADQQPHPGPQPLAALLGGQRLVVRADPGRGVGLQPLAEQARRVAVDVLRALPARASRAPRAGR